MAAVSALMHVGGIGVHVFDGLLLKACPSPRVEESPMDASLHQEYRCK